MNSAYPFVKIHYLCSCTILRSCENSLLSRQLYVEYPKVKALRSQFNWIQYRALIQIPDKDLIYNLNDLD